MARIARSSCRPQILWTYVLTWHTKGTVETHSARPPNQSYGHLLVKLSTGRSVPYSTSLSRESADG